MPNFFDLLKYAKTGIASPDMTHFDKMRARAIAGGFPVNTIEGVPPLTFQSDGKPLSALTLWGNGEQTGTPSPDNIIMPDFCGVRSAQIIDYTLSESGGIDASGDPVISSNLWRSTVFYEIHSGIVLSFAKYATLTSVRVNYYDANYTHISREQFNVGSASGVSLTIPANAKYFKWTLYASSGTTIDVDFVRQCYIMLNTGSTALPYEPYGYKIPFTNASQTVPVYLGQTQTVRRVQKLVLTGEEAWAVSTDNVFRLTLNGYARELGVIIAVSSHYVVTPTISTLSGWEINERLTFIVSSSGNNYMYIRDSAYNSNLNDFKSYLAQQYAAGTPVTIWYVLATPETAIVNEPLAKIGDYADELHSTDAGIIIPTAKGENTLTFDTAIQPSKVSITGTIKE